MTVTATLDDVDSIATNLGRPWTEEDYFALPEQDGPRVELIDGELFVSSQPDPDHQDIVGCLWHEFARLLPADLTAKLPVNVRLGTGRIVGPDVTVTFDLSKPKAYQAASVVLVAEVVSPSGKARDRIFKPHLYAEAGIPWFLIVEREPKVELTLYRLDGSGYVKHTIASEGEILEIPELCSIEVDALLRLR